MAESEHHGGVKLYWIFCVILCLITAFEWAIFRYKSEWGVSDAVLVASLVVCSAVKFVMVVGWYMHLKQDIRFLKNLFIFSFVGASLVFAGLYAVL